MIWESLALGALAGLVGRAWRRNRRQLRGVRPFNRYHQAERWPGDLGR